MSLVGTRPPTVDEWEQYELHHRTITELECPFCGRKTPKVHSIYEREIQDLPMQGKKVILLVDTRKMRWLLSCD